MSHISFGAFPTYTGRDASVWRCTPLQVSVKHSF